jgi:hypothetical protein
MAIAPPIPVMSTWGIVAFAVLLMSAMLIRPQQTAPDRRLEVADPEGSCHFVRYRTLITRLFDLPVGGRIGLRSSLPSSD